MESRGRKISCKGKIRCKRLDKWLNGMSLEEKLKTLKYWKDIKCVYCGLRVFDEEAPEDRICQISEELGHKFVSYGIYIILSRGSSGVKDIVFYQLPMTAEEAIIEYFKRKKH